MKVNEVQNKHAIFQQINRQMKEMLGKEALCKTNSFQLSDQKFSRIEEVREAYGILKNRFEQVLPLGDEEHEKGSFEF